MAPEPEAGAITPAHDDLVFQIRARAENLYTSRQFLCSEAILAAMNQGLGGGLTEDQAVGLAAGLAIGLGDSGCLCGALGGAILAVGLFLGQSKAHRYRREIRQAANELHRLFKERHRSTCCRVLSREVKDDPVAHFRQCANLTGDGAEWAARLVLERRPHLAGQAHPDYLARRDGRWPGRLKWLLRLLGF